MVWEYDTTKTAQENLQDFEAQMNVIGYELGELMGTPTDDSLKYMELRSKAGQELAKIANFNEARQVAFDELALQHNDERIALQTLWQEYENNDYTIPSGE